MAERWFEDYEVGHGFRSPGKTLTEDEIIDFAFRYDPQPFHIDKPAAEQGMYGGLIASGWHVMAVAFRLFLELQPFGQASLGSPGVDALRWLKPVRPGDTIHTEATVEAVRASRSRPDRGLVTMAYRVVNQHGETVASMTAVQLVRRRPA